MAQKKKRLDLILVERGLACSRTKAQALIMAGVVEVNGKVAIKSGEKFNENISVKILKPDHPYVGRGGLKLEKALDHFNIDVQDKVCLDAGASVGGFTHCLLLRGAKKVYAVDVGYGQIALSLRENPKVILIERFNVRYISPKEVPEKIDIITADLSFISLTLVMKPLYSLLKEGGVFIPLIKPQFEAGPKHVKKGIVRDPQVRQDTVRKILEYGKSIGLMPLGYVESPIKGAKGNVEFLACFVKK